MNAILLIDPNGIIEEVNHAFLNAFGYGESDLIGQNFSILFTEEDQKKDLPLRELRTVLDEGQSFDNNYLVNKNKMLTWVSGESVLLKNTDDQRRILKIIQNIHFQKESEYSIIRLNNFNENILGTIEDAVVVLDDNFRILKTNRSFRQKFNFSEQESSRTDFKAFIGAFDNNLDLYNAIMTVFQSRSSITRTQLEMASTGGDKQTFDISCTKMAGEGEQTRILLTFHDTTAQIQMDRQREDIFNFVAHEFRNPLTNVILNIDLFAQMLDTRELDGIGDLVERARVNAQRLKRLVSELYESTKVISGNIDPQRTVFTLDELIDEAIESVRLVYPEFTIGKDCRAKVSLFADREKLFQVIMNFLTNAAKYSDTSRQIEVCTELDGDFVIVSVQDFGRGIPSREIPFIFNRFYRAEKTKNLEGLGLGLFLSKQIISAHGGRAWVESEEGKGSTFYFSLQVASVEETVTA